MFLNGYPYTDFHELNLDFLLQSMEVLKKSFKDFTGANSLIFAEPLLHDITAQYAKNTIVVDQDGDAFISLQAVPTGIELSNSEYWLEVFDFEGYVSRANKNFTDNYFSNVDRSPVALSVGDWLVLDDVLYKVTVAIPVDGLFEVGTNITHFTVEQFLKGFITSVNATIQQYKDDIDASESLYRSQLAQDIADTTASLQAQLNEAISGVTVDSEVINARVGADDVTYDTLGDAIRTQITDQHMLTIEETTVLNGNELVDIWTEDPDFTNTQTDTRNHLFLFIQELDSGSPVNVVKQVHIQDTGLQAIFFNTTGSNLPFDTLKIFHNGLLHNIDIAEIAYSTNSSKMCLTFNVEGYDPTVADGIELTHIKLFEVNITLADLKNTNTRLNAVEGLAAYKFVNPKMIPASGYDQLSVDVGELIDLDHATINFVGDSMTSNQVSMKSLDPDFITFADYLHEKYPHATVRFYGYGGSTIAVNPDAGSPGHSFYERITGIDTSAPVTTEADVWIIWGGYNDVDVSCQTPLGTDGTTTDSTLYGALRAIIYNIQDRENLPRIILVTPHDAYGLQRYQLGTIDRLTNLRECFYTLGEDLSCQVVDLFKKAGLTNRNGVFLHTDSLHLNQNGYLMCYPHILKALESLYNT